VFYGIDPAGVLALPLSKFDLYNRQAERIADQRNKDNH
jgi:hypothetical protein